MTGPDSALAPYAVVAPAGARPVGTPPFWAPGTEVMWRFRDHGWAPGLPETATPMRVVRDDERGTVAWLAPGTVHLTKRYADGAGLRDVPLERRFHTEQHRVQALTRWTGAGILRIAPAGRPWSVWLFWDTPDGGADADWVFEGWYVNLENAHVRSGTATFTGDHVLDVWVDADGTISMKDEDELEAAVAAARFTPAEGEQVTANGRWARAAVDAGEWPFDPEWTRWRPDPTWTIPTLSRDERWDLDLTGLDLT
ncbi:MAG: DUF402 domain-containing protein [Terracoccus sp.]